MEADIDLAKAEANPLQRQITLTDLCDAHLLKHWRGKDLGRPAMVGWWMDVTLAIPVCMILTARKCRRR